MSLSLERIPNFAGLMPARGTYPIAANVRIFKGALVCIDSAGRVRPGGTIASGALAGLGKASATIDNRTGSALGGAAGAAYVEVEFGAFQMINSAAADEIGPEDIGKPCFVVDDQTVALTNNSDTRPIAGFITEIVDGHPYVWMGPHVAGMIVIAASEASQLDTAQADIDELQADALTAQAQVNIPITAALDVATGGPLAVFADGASTTPGTQLTNSKAPCVRWNNHATPGAIALAVAMPQDLDDTKDVVVHALVSKTGATVGDATKLTIGAFEQVVGALHDADTDFGGDTNAVTGDATAKTVTELTCTLALADVHPAPSALSLTIKPKAGTLGTDDLCLHACWLEYTRKLMTS